MALGPRACQLLMKELSHCQPQISYYYSLCFPWLASISSQRNVATHTAGCSKLDQHQLCKASIVVSDFSALGPTTSTATIPCCSSGLSNNRFAPWLVEGRGLDPSLRVSCCSGSSLNTRHNPTGKAATAVQLLGVWRDNCQAASVGMHITRWMSAARSRPPSFIEEMQELVTQEPRPLPDVKQKGMKSVLYFFEVDRPYMGTWEKLYWSGLLSVLLYLLYKRFRRDPTPEELEEQKRKAEELEAKRQETLRATMAGKSFLEGDDVFDGLLPSQIEEYIKKSRESMGMDVDDDDPYEGLSPEEIDEYIRTHGVKQ